MGRVLDFLFLCCLFLLHLGYHGRRDDDAETIIYEVQTVHKNMYMKTISSCEQYTIKT